MTKDEALKMARTALGVQLDALLGKAGHLRNDDRRRYAENGIKAIDEALAQPEQEPVGKLQEATAERAWFTIAELNAWADKKLSENPHWVMPKDEPERDEPPPQRKPLTEQKIGAILEDTNAFGTRLYTFARAIEAAHGIKGEA